jgi:signal transduction histidine kinase
VAWPIATEIPSLKSLLDAKKVSALLTQFLQLVPASTSVWLLDDKARLVASQPESAAEANSSELSAALDQVKQRGDITPVPMGVAAPVFLKSQLVGALIVAWPHGFDAYQTSTLQLLTHSIGILAEEGLTREDLLKETVDRYRDAHLLYRAVKTIAASLDLSRVNRVILEEFARLVQLDEAAILLRLPENGPLAVWASLGIDPAPGLGTGVPRGHELAQRVTQSGETELSLRSESDGRNMPLRSVVGVPLKAEAEVLGVISLARTAPGAEFGANEIRLINTLASQASIAIKNALMFRDLSKVHAELEEANRHLLELDKLKSSFLGIVTHELRSPFANLTFCVQLIERYGTQNWSEQQREYWGQLVDGIQGAKMMIDNLVSFASLLREQGKLDLGDVNFPRLVTDVMDALVPLARPRNIRLVIDGDADMPELWADERRLSKAVYHLVHNAIKFNRAGGMVRVRYRSDEDKVWFGVRDTGEGIPADKLKILWDPFSQAADPVKRGIEGLGLGLAMVKFVVDAHGGQVGVSSRKGSGSTFSFWVPMSVSKGPAVPVVQQDREVAHDQRRQLPAIERAERGDNGHLASAG